MIVQGGFKKQNDSRGDKFDIRHFRQLGRFGTLRVHDRSQVTKRRNESGYHGDTELQSG